MTTASGQIPYGAGQLSDLIACSKEPWQLPVTIADSNNAMHTQLASATDGALMHSNI